MYDPKLSLKSLSYTSQAPSYPILLNLFPIPFYFTSLILIPSFSQSLLSIPSYHSFSHISQFLRYPDSEGS
ncbi:unnamed protein product [Meloidogyne enterolobii]|uniref:Uncharacterized protein n=1 Tax=Meloidogyne enterolobii TaxID=390850 RepID=A0ACB0Y4B2_MELEN